MGARDFVGAADDGSVAIFLDKILEKWKNKGATEIQNIYFNASKNNAPELEVEYAYFLSKDGKITHVLPNSGWGRQIIPLYSENSPSPPEDSSQLVAMYEMPFSHYIFDTNELKEYGTEGISLLCFFKDYTFSYETYLKKDGKSLLSMCVTGTYKGDFKDGETMTLKMIKSYEITADVHSAILDYLKSVDFDKLNKKYEFSYFDGYYMTADDTDFISSNSGKTLVATNPDNPAQTMSLSRIEMPSVNRQEPIPNIPSPPRYAIAVYERNDTRDNNVNFTETIFVTQKNAFSVAFLKCGEKELCVTWNEATHNSTSPIQDGKYEFTMKRQETMDWEKAADPNNWDKLRLQAQDMANATAEEKNGTFVISENGQKATVNYKYKDKNGSIQTGTNVYKKAN